MTRQFNCVFIGVMFCVMFDICEDLRAGLSALGSICLCFVC